MTRTQRAKMRVRQRIRDFLVDCDGACTYCGVALTRETATVDHQQPRAHGGTDHSENLVLACRPCNRARGTISVASFARLMRLAKTVGRVSDMQRPDFARRADALGYLPECARMAGGV